MNRIAKPAMNIMTTSLIFSACSLLQWTKRPTESTIASNCARFLTGWRGDMELAAAVVTVVTVVRGDEPATDTCRPLRWSSKTTANCLRFAFPFSAICFLMPRGQSLHLTKCPFQRVVWNLHEAFAFFVCLQCFSIWQFLSLSSSSADMTSICTCTMTSSDPDPSLMLITTNG